ncbi:MAG: DnaB-like helicase N-terminal domain-containing protein, partial [Oscillospiraceae bacterium]
YISRIAKEQDVPKESLREQIESIIRKRKKADEKAEERNIRTFSSERKEAPEAVMYPAEYKSECGVIAYLAHNPDKAGKISAELLPEYFVTDFHRQVYIRILEKLRSPANFDIMSLQSEFSADEMGRITAILSKNRDIEIDEHVAEDYVRTLKESYDRRSGAVPASEMSDDDFRDFAKNIRKNK